MIKQIDTNNKLISRVGIGMIFLSGVCFPSEAMGIVTSHEDDDNQVNYLAELALTVIDYDHNSNIATNLDLSLLNFSEEERRQLALELNPTSNSPQLLAATPSSLIEGVKMLVSDRKNNEDNQSDILYTSYLASSLEVAKFPTYQQENTVAILPKTEVNKIYHNAYEFDIAVQQKEYTLDSNIGEMLSDTNQSDQSAQKINPKSHGLQKQIAPANNGGNLSPIVGSSSSIAPSPTTRSNSGFKFFAIGQQFANPSGLINTGQVDYVQQQLVLQQASKANVEQKTQTFYRPSTTANFKY